MKKILATGIALMITTVISAQNIRPGGLRAGDKAPAFNLRDQDGKLFKSEDLIGKSNLVIFFYPKDESVVCTREACSFRDNFEEFRKAGAVVMGINAGSIESHKKFRDKEKLPFSLLSDPDNKILRKFGVPNQFFITGRRTFVIDKQGKIIFTFDSALNGSAHAEEALTYLRKANK